MNDELFAFLPHEESDCIPFKGTICVLSTNAARFLSIGCYDVLLHT